jgi:hypothetical protein
VFKDLIPPHHPLSPDYTPGHNEDLLHHLRSQKTLDDALIAVSDISSKAMEEVGEVHNLLLVRAPLYPGRGQSS